MPTTRSQGRSEPLQRLQTPPKRQRKQKSRRPRLLVPTMHKESLTRNISVSPEHEEFLKQEQATIAILKLPLSYCDASTQTDDVVILTHTQAADLRDRATTASSNKRGRNDESEEEPTAKRHQFSTPQNEKGNNRLWMFGDRANGDHPQTAPSKPFGVSSRRAARGPLVRQHNFQNTARVRARPTVPSDPPIKYDSIKPIEQEVRNQSARSQDIETQEETQITDIQTDIQQSMPTTPRRGLFGSLRGIVHKGWDLAASFTPIGHRTAPAQTEQPNSEAGHVLYPNVNIDEDDEDVPAGRGHQQAPNNLSRPRQPVSDNQQRSSQYDHLHYIPADADSVDKAMNGEIEPPDRSPTPPSPASRLKAQNPELSDAAIGSILRKRERKAARDQEKYGPQPNPEASTVAPLFGPDSHYNRGTVDPRFLPRTPLYGPSKKRKHELTEGQTPPPKQRGLETDEDIEDEVMVDNTDRSNTDNQVDIDVPSAKRHKSKDTPPQTSNVPVTPRSALKKPGINGSVGRKSVAFGSSMSRDIRGHYGPAGQYKGSTFADDSLADSRSPSSIDHNDTISPSTRLNTLANSNIKPVSVFDNLGARVPPIDFTVRDPNDATWRPSLGNPRPGAFRVPDVDEEDPDESMSDVAPEQPQTPRISHAELPTPSTFGSFNESSIVHESTELALDKARSKAEKYKPKSSSRLSEVSRARSRSTSPDEKDLESTVDATTTSESTAPAAQSAAPPQPYVPLELDNKVKGSDGMTDYEREHQFDEWAANLKWDALQTYEDAGTGSAFIHNLIRKNWTEEDSRRSEVFWAREFDEVDRAMQEAKAKGQLLELVTGMEEIEGY